MPTHPRSAGSIPPSLPLILESTGDGALILDDKRAFVFANERFLRETGYSPDDMRSDGAIRTMPPALVDGIAAVLAGEESSWEGRVDGWNKAGEPSVRQAVVVPVRDDPKTKPSSVVVLLKGMDGNVDVATERASHFEQLIEAIPNPVLLKDPDLRYVKVNKAYEEYFGVRLEDLIGRRLEEVGFVDQDLAAECSRQDAEIFANGGSLRYRSQVRFRDGRVGEALFLLVRMQDASGTPTGVLGVVFDIADLGAKERELAEAKSRAEQEIRDKTMFLANMSHEIRTPLNALVGMSHLLAGMELGTRQRQHAEKIRTAGLALQSLVDEMLDYTRLEVGQIELNDTVFGFDEIFRVLDAVLGEKARAKGLSFILERDPELHGSFRFDKFRLNQVLTNLAGNAVKFTHSGDVEVGCRMVERRGDEVLVRFDVADTGIGMNREQIGRLFRPFTQGDGSITRRFGGTGLGLCISSKLVEIMGGRLEVDSRLGKGSIFHFELWMSRVSELSEIPDMSVYDAIVHDTPLRDLRILLVEDEPLNRETTADILVAEGANVLVASSGEEALSILMDEEGDVDIVLMDIGMPGMTGMEAARRIREEPILRNIPVVALSAHVLDEDWPSESAGFVGQLTKPCPPERLREAVLHWTGQGCDSEVDSDVQGTGQEFDKGGGLKRLGDGKGFLQALLRFRQEQGAALERIARFVADGRRADAKPLARRLRAESAYIGGTELQRRARLLEIGLGSDADVGRVLAAVERAYARLSKEILAMLDESEFPVEGEEPVPPPEDETLAQLGEFLRRSDGAAIDLYDTIERQMRPWFGPERAGEFNDAVRSFDFDRASRIIEGERMRRRRTET